MITESTLYWITRLDIFHNIGVGMTAIGLIAIFVVIMVFSTSELEWKYVKSFVHWGIIPLVFGLLVVTFVPTTKEMCVIKVIPAIINNEKVQSLGNEVYNSAMDWLKELRNKK